MAGEWLSPGLMWSTSVASVVQPGNRIWHLRRSLVRIVRRMVFQLGGRRDLRSDEIQLNPITPSIERTPGALL
ncbi:hypothetical protein SEA_YOGI_2 [Rhodococcus phage Yogi]|nr:hypothetical protein SEA_YOGI_2 [Rhodococcus phage Yogi]